VHALDARSAHTDLILEGVDWFKDLLGLDSPDFSGRFTHSQRLDRAVSEVPPSRGKRSPPPDDTGYPPTLGQIENADAVDGLDDAMPFKVRAKPSSQEGAGPLSSKKPRGKDIAWSVRQLSRRDTFNPGDRVALMCTRAGVFYVGKVRHHALRFICWCFVADEFGEWLYPFIIVDPDGLTTRRVLIVLTGLILASLDGLMLNTVTGALETSDECIVGVAVEVPGQVPPPGFVFARVRGPLDALRAGLMPRSVVEFITESRPMMLKYVHAAKEFPHLLQHFLARVPKGASPRIIAIIVTTFILVLVAAACMLMQQKRRNMEKKRRSLQKMRGNRQKENRKTSA
jgi:hypothetical protein